MRVKGVRVVLFIGPPASGKGTHGKLIGGLPGFVHFSMGQVFRTIRPRNEEETRKLEEVARRTARGHLAPDELTLDLFYEHVERMEAGGQFHRDHEVMILDGIPRTRPQAESLMARLKILAAFIFECPDEVILERIRNRSIAEGRADDSSREIIETRLRIYRQELEGIETALAPAPCVHVDTGRPAHHVLRDILSQID